MAYTITNKQREGALIKLTRIAVAQQNKLNESDSYWIDQLIGYLQPPTRSYYKFEDEELTLLSTVGIEEDQLGIH